MAAGAASLGGAVWSVHALLLAARPEGCIAAACGTRAHRPSEDLAWLLLVAVMLIAVSAGLVAARAPRRGRGLLWSGTGLVAAGAVLLAVGIMVNATGHDSPLWWLHDSDALGRFLPVLGGVLTGAGLLRGRILPRWAGLALVAGAIFSFGFNVQNARVLLVLPLGLAWVAFAYAVWTPERPQNR